MSANDLPASIEESCWRSPTKTSLSTPSAAASVSMSSDETIEVSSTMSIEPASGAGFVVCGPPA
jgi:hypothetical protein